MTDQDRLDELFKDTKEDAPVPVSVFKEFIYNHFAHLKWQVALNTKLSWIILVAIIGAVIVNIFTGG